VVASAFDADAVSRAVEQAKPDAVVDLMTALPRNGPMRVSDLRPTNELRRTGSANLAAAARAHGAGKIVGESIAFVYGFRAGDAPATEEDVPAIEGSSAFSEALRAAVEKERRIVDAGGIALRFGFFYGPGVGSTEYMLRMLRRRMMGLPGGGRGIAPLIHVEDAAAAVLAGLDHPTGGQVYNVVDDEPTTWRAFVEELSSRLGTPRPYGVPMWLARLVAPYPADFIGRSRLTVSNEKAKRELGWKPEFPTFRDGIAAMDQRP
jgi:nucleoside-diphosphate-sugar epimerase